ncbi:DUF2460 domain-containing protein [Fulvimarina sp. 2208YS6-2-32]|uniref:DUF2460 domain-containing protein n=1 Tax=Fulvimarina uroteuthidis TaxID=3098149 RepID=A0ABU5I194_9HYPH|nr:DUF2460 domain-containing protein [Fulvimarina sp. 2208YS6-2-32]MDY8109117.1 DUF2460 domain-containing protein [Fulvimarina sp. 2208YS6-2-32]
MAIQAFSDERFPLRIGFGASGGPERRVEIVRLSTGFEHRNQRTAHAVRRYDAGSGVKSLADLAEVVAFFEARRGKLVGFRFRDPMDWTSAAFGKAPGAFDVSLGTGDGTRTRFPLLKRYGSGPQAYERPIGKAVAGSLRIALDGAAVMGGFRLDPGGGAVSFDAPPPAGVTVEAGFAFDVPVRFDTDQLSVNVTGFEAGEIPSIPLIEVRP